MEVFNLNIIILKGNITRDVEMKFQEKTGLAIAKFGIAVSRMKKDESDFFNVVAFGKIAEVIADSLQKGSPILIEGHLQSGSYDNKEGKKVYTTDVIVNRFEFVSKKGDSQETSHTTTDNNEGATPIDDGDIPF